MKARHTEINAGFAQNKYRSMQGRRTLLASQYIMKNTARNAIPINGTNGITGFPCYGIIRYEEVFSHEEG